MEEYRFFNIPESCNVGNIIYKKLFYENGDLAVSDKELFTDVINKITWLYCMKRDTINIKPYKDEARDYSEIEFLEVTVTEDKKIRRIAEIIMRTITYPMVLVFKLNDSIKIVTAHVRINQNDSSQNTIDEFISTGWLKEDDAFFNRLDMMKMNFTNCYILYCDIVDTISIYNAECILGKPSSMSGDKAREFLSKINNIGAQIETLKSSIKNETQFNRKVELNIKIKQLEKARDKFIKEAASYK